MKKSEKEWKRKVVSNNKNKVTFIINENKVINENEVVNDNNEIKVNSDEKNILIEILIGIERTKQPYLLKLPINEILPIIAGKRIVTIDLNKDDIIYCFSPKSVEHRSTATQNKMIESGMICFYKNEGKRKQRLIKMLLSDVKNTLEKIIQKQTQNMDTKFFVIPIIKGKLKRVRSVIVN